MMKDDCGQGHDYCLDQERMPSVGDSGALSGEQLV